MVTQFSYFVLFVKSYFAREEGQDLIEYALIAGLLALAAVAGLMAMSGTLETMWLNLSGALGTAAAGG
jgi:pilus assembly protein Flp/PilA